jgi:uncharacterized protein
MHSPIRVLVCASLCALVLINGSPAQQKKDPNSPVFKSYKPPPEPNALEPIDPVYESWQAFITERRAGAGDAVAQHEMGIRYLLGRGVQADTARAAYWIGKAAANGVLQARFNLGILAYEGWGVPWNPYEAFRQFQNCAERDMPEGQYALAIEYLQDLVVPRDWDKAESWMQRAADNGYAQAKSGLEELRRSRLQQAGGNRAAAGDSAAAMARGDSMHAAPVFLHPPDDTTSKGTEWTVLRSALREADPEVRAALGISRIIEEDLELDSLGFAAITQAAEKGSPEALAVLGRCYERGIIVGLDPVMAAYYYIRAIRLDWPRAGELLWKLTQQRETLESIKRRAEAGSDTARYCWALLLGLEFGYSLVQANAYITDRQALAFLETNVAHGHQASRIELGLCYYVGRWVPQDTGRAIELWRKAAEGGSREAAIRLAVVAVRANRAPTDVGSALDTLRVAAREGSVLAEVALGYCYETGIGVPVALGEAADHYRNAARRGSQDAFRALRRLHDATRPKGEEFRMSD